MCNNSSVSNYSNLLDKYKPKTFDDLILSKYIRIFINKCTSEKNIPHLLIEGPSSSGKTSLVKILLNEIYEDTTSAVLELNATEERSIKTVRLKIKKFSSELHYCNDKQFKVVILDEADSLTNDSQFALRRLMETYCYTTRFILICNYINSIIEPLKSRCFIIHLQKLCFNSLLEILNNILEKENITLTNEEKDNLIQMSDSDIRQIMINLQIMSLKKPSFTSFEWIESLHTYNNQQLVDLVNQLVSEHVDLIKLLKHITTLYQSVYINNIIQNILVRISNNSCLYIQLLYLCTTLRFFQYNKM